MFLLIVSAVFVSVIAFTLILLALDRDPLEHFDRDEFLTLKASFRETPTDQELADSIRVQDVRLREQYFGFTRKVKIGAFLLLIGAIVLILSLRRLAALAETLPEARRTLDIEEEHLHYRSRVMKASLLAILPVIVVLFGLMYREPDLHSPSEDLRSDHAVIPLPDVAPVAEYSKWTGLLGNSGQRRAPAMDIPTNWDAATGENLLWKTEIPLGGNSSPVVWSDHVFVTGADLDARNVYCFSARDGHLKWTCGIRTNAMLGEGFRMPGETGLAAPTAATDGRYVFAFFGTNELAAVDFDGQQVWSRWLGVPESIYGIATSPIVHDGKVILQLDQGDEDEGLSFLYAFDASNGEELWKVPRRIRASWSSPLIVEQDAETLVITAANPYAIAYELETGKEVWRAKVLSGDAAPVPAFGAGMVFVTTQYAPLTAIRLGGSGDVTETHIVWEYDGETPDVASPLTDGELLILANGYGTVVCFDALSGEEIWVEEFRQGFWSSPVLIGDRVFLTDIDGKTFIFKMDRSYIEEGVGEVGEYIAATPAFADSKIFVRSKNALYCIGR